MLENKTENEKVETAKKPKISFVWIVYICTVILLGYLVFSLLPKGFKIENFFNNPTKIEIQNTNTPTTQDSNPNNITSSSDNKNTSTNQEQTTKSDLKSKQYFSGKIDNQNVSMVLNITDSVVTGFYSYDHFNNPLKLTGTIDKTQDGSSAIKLDEFINDLKNASFELNLERQDPSSSDVSLIGKWTKVGEDKTLDVLLYTAFPENFYLSNTKANEIQITPKTNTETQKFYTIAYTYPQISGLKDNKIQDSINKSLTQYSDITKTKADFEDILKTDTRSTEDPNFTGYSDEIDYHINYNQNNLLSVEFSGYNYSGGAHGIPFVKTLNFDLKTGKELKLNDIFKTDSNYLNYFSTQSKQKLATKFANTDMQEYFNEGLEPKNENYENWSFTPNGGINITFGAYQVVAYAFGTPTIHFTTEDLKDILKTEYNFPASPIQ